MRRIGRTFRAGTTLVEFTIVALDDKGNPVTDLTREDLVVTEQGQPREVVFFRFEGAPEPRASRAACHRRSAAARRLLAACDFETGHGSPTRVARDRFTGRYGTIDMPVR